MPAQGRTLGPYSLSRLIGRGSSGMVHLAQDQRDQSWVALKVLAPLGIDDDELEQAHAQFLRDAAALRRLRHPGIVAVLDAGASGDTMWLALELMAGADLTRYTRPARLLPDVLVLRIGERIAQALAYAHAAGFVHRDVKPANLMAHWPDDTLKLADFGIARSADMQATRTGVVLGTPAYLAPEQLAGAAAEPRTDLYALGITLFQLLCGRLPFESDSMGDLLKAVATQPAPALSAFRADLPEALVALVASLLRKSTHERPQSAAQLAIALADIARSMNLADDGRGGGLMSRP